MSHPVIDCRQEAAILHEMLLQDQRHADHAAITTIDEVAETLNSLSDPKHVMTDGSMAEVAYISLGLIHPLVKQKVRIDLATKASGR